MQHLERFLGITPQGSGAGPAAPESHPPWGHRGTRRSVPWPPGSSDILDLINSGTLLVTQPTQFWVDSVRTRQWPGLLRGDHWEGRAPARGRFLSSRTSCASWTCLRMRQADSLRPPCSGGTSEAARDPGRKKDQHLASGRRGQGRV